MIIKCTICGADMISQTGGNYYCPKCGFEVNGFVYVLQSYDMPLTKNSSSVQYGWICPRCGKVYSPSVNSCGCNSTSGTIKSNSTESMLTDINISPTGTITFNMVDVKDINSITRKYNPAITWRNNK